MRKKNVSATNWGHWRRAFFVFAALVTCGCDHHPKQEPDITGEGAGLVAGVLNPVGGTVFALRSVPDVEVRLYRINAADGERGEMLAQARTNAVGAFVLDAGMYEGPALIETEPTPTLVLRHALAKVALGDTATHHVVTPITTFTSTYATFLARNGLAWPEAVLQAAHAIDRHFLGLEHGAIVPEAWPTEIGASRASCGLEQPATQVSLLNRGLAVAGVMFLQPDERELTEEEGLSLMLAGLCADLRDDGRWDGTGSPHALSQKYLELGAEAPREKLITAIESFLQSSANKSGCTSAHAEETIKHLRDSALSPLAPRGVVAKETAQPVAPKTPTLRCLLHDDAGVERSFEETLRGILHVKCRWQADEFLSKIDLEGHNNDVWLTTQPSEDPHELAFLVDTKKAEEVLQVRNIRVRVRGENEHGVIISDQVDFHVRNTAPTFEVGPVLGATRQDPRTNRLWYTAGAELQMPLRVPAATHFVRLLADDKLVAESAVLGANVDGSETTAVTLTTRLDTCDRSTALRLVVIDLAGNESSVELQALCSSQGPTIRPMHASHRQDFSGAVEDLSRGWNLQDFPHLQKFFHRFDFDPAAGRSALSENLPVLRFAVDDDSPGSQSKSTVVRYDYRFWGSASSNNGSATVQDRSWENLAPLPDGTYEIPLSYQTLLPQSLLRQGAHIAKKFNFLATSKPGDLHQIRICVENEAGQSEERLFRFHLDVRGPPLVLHNFRLAPAVANATYNDALKQLTSGAELVLAEASWDIGTGSSLVPEVDLEVSVRMAMSVDSRVEHVTHWDYGDVRRRDYLDWWKWPPNQCETEQRVFNSSGHNTAWSMSRGCHPPLINYYARGLTVRSLRNAAVYEHDASLIRPRQWAKAGSQQSRTVLGRSNKAPIGLRFPSLAVAHQDWDLRWSEEKKFRRYHASFEDDFHFIGKKLHLLSTHYYVQEFDGHAMVPSPQMVSWHLSQGGVPDPCAVVVEGQGATLLRHWKVDDHAGGATTKNHMDAVRAISQGWGGK